MLQTFVHTRHAGARSTTVGYRDILVHLDGTPEDETRLAHAEALTLGYEAHLTGLYTNRLPDIADYAAPVGVMAYAELTDRLRAEGAIVRQRLAQRLERIGAPHELRMIEAAPDDMRRAAASEARAADLFISSCPQEREDQWRFLIEEVLFAGGRSVLLAPQGVRPREALRTIVVGWVDAREAARAVAEALPLLKRAGSAELVCVVPGHARADDALAGCDIAGHLDRHGVAVNLSIEPGAPHDAATALLDKAHRVSADLIVTGAYSHSRLRERILGGVTRDLMAWSDIPLLMAH